MRLKYKIYRYYYNYFMRFIGNSFLGIRIKWNIALFFVGLEFHEQNLKTKKKFSHYLDPRMPLQKELQELIPQCEKKETIRILDLGAGPISKVGKICKGRKIELIPLDPLADKYCKLLKDNDIQPPVYPIVGYGDKLSKMFSKNTFDLIHMRNSLDHTKNPMVIIFEMLKVLKLNHYIYLNHYINEGENTNYYGLHLWNFLIKNKDFVIQNKNKKISYNVTQKLKKIAIVNTKPINNRLIVTIKKN